MKLLVISGGSRHPYEESTPVLESFLTAAGHQVTVTEDTATLAAPDMGENDGLVFNTRREGELTLKPEEQVGLTRFVGSGKGFVCIHISGCRPECWPEYHDVTGGGWITGSSTDRPYGEFQVNVSKVDHPCADGLSGFATHDELYMKLGWKPGNEVFLTAELDGEVHPLAWTRSYGNGRVFNTTLGHDGLSFQTPEFQRLVLNGVAWATGAG